MSWKNQ